MSTNYSPTIVTDGIVGNWDPEAREYPPRGLATTWTDYNSQSANYTILGDDGVILKDTSTAWIGYFPATLTSLGGYTVTFDVVADVAASTFTVNNDGTSNNAFLKTISVGTTLTRITLKGTITSISSPVCQVFLQRNSGGNITITNFRLFESGPWLYDSAGGSDGRGSGNNGLMYNGTCLAFDGTDDRIELDDLDSQFSDYFTLSVWLRPLDVTGQTWVFAGENGGGIGFYIRQSNDDLIFRHNGIGDGTTNVTAFFSYSEANQAAPVSTAWIHCVFNWDGVNTNVYRDGVRVGGEAATGTLAADAFNDPRIGDDSAAGDREWYGEMADFRLYNVALSASQVTEIYNDSKVIIPSNVSQTNLIVWYPMTEGAGDLVYDGSGKGYTGTFSNAPTWTTGQTGPPQLVEGYNRPMLFDGNNDYVGVEDSVYGIGSFPTGAATRTIAGWVWFSDATATGGVFGYGTNPASADTIFEFYNYGASGIRLHYATYNSGGTTALSSKTWYHLAGTYDGTTAKVYINGVLDHSDAETLSTVSDFARIGANNYSGSAAEFFDGMINEVVFYNTALSLAQVQALAATGPNGGPLPPDPVSLSNSSNIVAYWRNDGDTTWKNRAPGVVKNFTDVATDPINDSNSIGDWTNNGTSLTSVTGGRTGFIDGAMRVAPRYRLFFDSGLNQTVNSLIPVTAGKTYKVSAWYLAGTVTSAMLRVDNGGWPSPAAMSTPVSLSLTSNTTSWTNKTAIFTPTGTGNIVIELHNRAVGTQYFDDVTLVESGPALDGTVNGSPDTLLFKQGYNGSGSTSTGRDNQGFPLKYKDVGAVGFDADATDNYINIADSAELDNIWDGGGTTDTWIYPASDGESDGGRIYEKTQWNLLTHSQSGDNVKLQFYIKFTGTDGTWDTDVVVPINEWSNIVVTYDADDVANTPTIYINGVAYTVGDGLTASTTPTGAREDDDGEDLQIGNNDTPSRTFDGQISGLKMYNRALSVAEITQNMNAQRSRFE